MSWWCWSWHNDGRKLVAEENLLPAEFRIAPQKSHILICFQKIVIEKISAHEFCFSCWRNFKCDKYFQRKIWNVKLECFDPVEIGHPGSINSGRLYWPTTSLIHYFQSWIIFIKISMTRHGDTWPMGPDWFDNQTGKFFLCLRWARIQWSWPPTCQNALTGIGQLL